MPLTTYLIDRKSRKGTNERMRTEDTLPALSTFVKI